MKQQILKPENWQDFEELCKMLWGEIWDCPEIKKNGRAGQNQHGVDVCGIPKNQKYYYGIQCKGKDEYTKAALTEKEVVVEIEKAKSFKPKLKKLYFATTANKDEKIEEFVRLKNVENIEQDLFEVHLFCWEDIAYLIEQNKRAYDWYIKKRNFASNHKIEVTFEDGETTKSFKPIMLKNHIEYRYKEDNRSMVNIRYYRDPATLRKTHVEIATEPQPVRYYLNGISYNRSSCVFAVRLKNIGNLQLENFKLYLTFEDDNYRSETVSKQNQFLDTFKYEYNIRWNKGTNDLELKTANEILVPNDEIRSDKICLRPDIEFPFCIIIPWKLVSKDHTEFGKLHLEIDTKVKEKNSIETYSAHFANETILENYKGHEEVDD